MTVKDYFKVYPKRTAFFCGTFFLVLFWIFAFDGITFSDDVYYLLAGKNFWEGTMEFNSYHFSTRWGAYVPSGLVGVILGFDPHRISLVSLISYLGTLGLILKVLPKNINPYVLTIWFCSQVYFLHFLTKVYPDSQLVFWTVLVPFSAVYRNEKPFLSALGIVFGLFFGFLTKETIIYLFPFPIILAVYDWQKKKINWHYYVYLTILSLLVGFVYLGYFWIEFGDPFFRINSIHEGHYISEYSYNDKNPLALIYRLTFLPIVHFVERSYWLLLVFSIPGILTFRKFQMGSIEFILCLVCLMFGFWFMSTSLIFYNPLYLNPRHLIILVPILAFLIAIGWEEWQDNSTLKWTIIGLILLGVGISLIQQDWKMAGFQALAAFISYSFQGKKAAWTFGIFLMIPALFSINYQQKLKEYKKLTQTLEKEISTDENQSPILTNNFLDFSKEILFPEDQASQELLFPIEKLDSIKSNPPQHLRVFIYDYYRHAYPKEQEDVDMLEIWLKNGYTLQSEKSEGQLWIRAFSRN